MAKPWEEYLNKYKNWVKENLKKSASEQLKEAYECYLHMKYNDYRSNFKPYICPLIL